MKKYCDIFKYHKKQYINIYIKREAEAQRLRSLSLRSLTSLLPFALSLVLPLLQAQKEWTYLINRNILSKTRHTKTSAATQPVGEHENN